MHASPSSAAGPQEFQAVQVRIRDGAWQPAVYRNGQFIDRYGLPLDPRWISAWEPAGEDARAS